MATVTVPSEFFRQELRVYSDWRQAFARELLQNSVDAGATRIDIDITTTDTGARVTFADNGSGMTRDTLDNVFFALGRTTKVDNDTIGGFGRARIILCFAQRAYEIRTANLAVHGSGGEYTIDTVADHQVGCVFTIDLIDDDADNITYAFERFLDTCTIAPAVNLNGEQAPRRTLPERAARVFRDADGNPWGKVYVLKDQVGAMYVRVGGLNMFRQWLAGNDDAIIELDPRRSRDVMSASRDKLIEPYASQLDVFVDNLSKNRRAALTDATEPLDVHITSGGFLRSDATVDDPATSETIDGDNASDTDIGDTITVPVTPANAAAAANMAATAPRIDTDVAYRPEQAGSTLGFDVFMRADVHDVRVRKLVRAWNPAGWDDTKGSRRRALLLGWKAAVQAAVDALVALPQIPDGVTWTVGWTFTEGTAATHSNVDGGHVFSLNPVDSTGRTRYRVSDKASRQRLLALAAHEVCHVYHGDHDESFAGLLTEVHATLDMAGADRLIRDAVATA